MRQDRTIQASIFDLFSDHQIGCELRGMSDWLDEHLEVLEIVAADLRRCDVKDTGCQGLSVESVVRCGLLKQYRQLSYQELAFHLLDSHSFRAFARLPVTWCPKKSVLQKTISAVSADSWEQINDRLRQSAQALKIETGKTFRIDSTVTETTIHDPTDSSLLYDSVRVMVRLLAAAGALPKAPLLVWHNHQRRAKRRAYAITNSRGKDKKAVLYKDLIAVTKRCLGYLDAAVARLYAAGVASPALTRGRPLRPPD